MYVCESRSVTSNSLRPPRLHGPWYSAGQNTGVGSLSLLQGYIYTHTYIYIYTHTHTHIYITLLKGNKRIYIINFHWVGQNFVQVFLRDIMEEPQRTFWSTQYGFILLYPWGNKPLERASFTSVLPSLQHCIKIRHAEQSHCKSCLWRESLAMAIQCIKTHQI